MDAIAENVIRRMGGVELESATSKIEADALERLRALISLSMLDGHSKPWLSVRQWKEEQTNVKQIFDKPWEAL